MTAINTELRAGGLDEISALLEAQQAAKVDAVVPAQAIRSEMGTLRVRGMRLFGDAELRPTEIMDTQIATRLDIPPAYLKRLHQARPDLYDLNVNGWIYGMSEGYATRNQVPADERPGPDERKFLVRSFLDEDGKGIGRALFSDRYAPIDNLDVLFSALEGINQARVECHLVKATLSERRMTVRFAAPGVAALAPKLLEGYRAPVPGWGDLEHLRAVVGREGMSYAPGTEPVVFAGFEISNSETGGSAFEVTPVITVQVCKNGLKLNLTKFRRVHLGGRLEEGTIDWSHETQQHQMALVRSQTVDAVHAFLNIDFLRGEVARIEENADKPIEDPVQAVELVAQKLAYSDSERSGILKMFVQGGQMTAGGILNAVTAYAQTVESPDAAFDLENRALEAFELVAA